MGDGRMNGALLTTPGEAERNAVAAGATHRVRCAAADD
jgi:hypothetical protein